MKKRRALLLVGAVLSISAASWAAMSQPVLITSIEVDDAAGPGAGTTTSTYLSFSTAPNNQPSCQVNSQAVIDGTAEHVRAVTSLATAAMLAGKNVQVAYLSCSTPLAGATYPRVANIKLVQ